MKTFNRYKMNNYPLKSRLSKVNITETCVQPGDQAEPLEKEGEKRLERIAEQIRKAREKNRAVILAFGAHTIKNGLEFQVLENGH